MSVSPDETVRQYALFPMVVTTYIDLITRNTLAPSKELKRLYLKKSGVLGEDIINIDTLLAQYDQMGLFPRDYTQFYSLCVSSNLLGYGRILLQDIRTMLTDGADGASLKHGLQNNTSKARRSRYYPSPTIMKRLVLYFGELKVYGPIDRLIGSEIDGLVYDTQLDLDRIVQMDGVISPQDRATGLTKEAVDLCDYWMNRSHAAMIPYGTLMLPIVKILLVYWRLLRGDVANRSFNNPVQNVDLMRKIRISDTALACTPCPVLTIMETFNDLDEPILSGRGCRYLNALESLL